MQAVTEIIAPNGYILNSTPEIVKLEAGKTATVILKNSRKPSLTIKKYDEDTAFPLENAEFSVAKKGGTIVYEGLTDKSGQIFIEGLDEGWYTVTEIAPPYGYLIATESKDVYLGANDSVEIKFDNRLRPALQIMKIDSVTNKPLMGAKFKLTKTEDKTVSEFITDETGVIHIQNLDEGIYTVEEISAPDGYILQGEIKTIALEWGKTKTLIFENTKKPTLIITKTDALTNKGIPNTYFMIQYETSNGGVVTLGTYKTDENGQIRLKNVNVGWYIITETRAAQGYQLPSNPVTRKYLAEGENAYSADDEVVAPPVVEPVKSSVDDVTGGAEEVDEYGIATTEELEENIEHAIVVPMSDVTVSSGLDYGVDVPNYPLNSIIIKKSDAITKEMLQGATFEVIKTSGETSGTNGTVIMTVTTDVSGVIVVTGLEAGTYAIKEIDPPTNYLIAETNLQTVTLKADGTSIVEVLFNNYPYGSLLINKVDSKTNNPMQDVKFQVTTGDGTAVGSADGIYYTNNMGQILVPNLKPDSYVVTELATLPNYVLDPIPQTIQIGTDGATYNVYFDNAPYGSLLIKKIDGVTKEPLANVKFKVVNSNGTIVGNSNGEYTTDSNGEILISSLPPDSYVVTEIQAPDNYLLDSTPKTIDVKADGEIYTLEFLNYPYSTILISKVDGTTKQPLANAEFKVTTPDEKLVGNYKTDLDGQISIPNLAAGTYIITETKAPENYALDTTPKTVEIKADGTVYPVEFVNYPYASIVISKIDGTNKNPLSKAEFTVTKADGTPVGEYETDLDGMITIPNLEPATYVVTETKSPDNYALDKTPQTVEVKADGGVYKLEFLNYPYSTLLIKKVDGTTKQPLANAQFTVTKADGTPVGEYETDLDGKITIPNLAPGSYIVTETVAPPNYVLDKTPQTIEIGADGKVYETEFVNYPYGSLLIRKVDGSNNQPLSGAKFKVTTVEGIIVHEGSTDSDGKILIANLEPANYIVTETVAPPNFVLDETPKTVTVNADNRICEVEFINYPYASILITKLDGTTNKPLANAKFKITTSDGAVAGNSNGEFTSDVNGEILIPNLKPGSYVVTELVAPDSYALNDTPQTIEIGADGEIYKMTFANYPYASLLIMKVDGTTNLPLANAKFKVTSSDGTVVGNSNGEYVTDVNGEILIPNLKPDSYVVTELIAPENYVLDDTPQTVKVGADGEIYKVTFANYPYSNLLITKVDAKTNLPLSNAQFQVVNGKGEVVGNGNGKYTTDTNGEILISQLKPDSYVVTELVAPENYYLDDTPQTIEIDRTGETYKVSFENEPYSTIVISKKDADSKEPLANAKFKVTDSHGTVVGENNGFYTTDLNGTITIPFLPKDSYIIEETEAPDGYLLEQNATTIATEYGKTHLVEITNKKLTSLVIKKVDDITGDPLVGADFFVEKQNGEHIGEFTTDSTGTILIPQLDPDYYLIRETKAPSGYMLDETPKTVEVKTNVPTVVTFTNKPLSGIKIIKTDSESGEPLEGVVFAINKMNGEKLGNFTTDEVGMIYVPNLEDGYYQVTETQGLEGYHWDEAPQTVLVESGKQTIVEVKNQPYSMLVIEKTSSTTGEYIEGVEFLVTKQNGEQIGYYKTNSSGQIRIEGLPDGIYTIVETKEAAGYRIDTTAHDVELKDGKGYTLKVENEPLGSVMIRKVDSITKEGIYGVVFLLYDNTNAPIGQYISDNEGYIWIDKELPDGKYSLREIQPAEGYIGDDVPRTFYIQEGRTTDIVWENTAETGQIIITKRAADFNHLTGLPEGAPLAGASFEVYSLTGNVVDKFVSNASGIAASKQLPVGVYVVKEVSAPTYYALDGRELIAEIRTSGDIVRFEVLNKSLDLNLTIRKKSTSSATVGQTLKYDIYDVSNQSSAPLTNFYIHDRIPTDATRVTKVVTGTYSERTYYKLTYKTNYTSEYRVLAENLLTKNSYEYSLHSNVLGLQNGEYVTDVRLEFPQVSSGFTMVDEMSVYCQVMPNIPKDYTIVNRAEVGGVYQNQWESAKASWNTTVWALDTPTVSLPRTGY